MPLVRRLSHVCLGTTDLEGLISFYERLLEARVIHEFRNPAGTRYGALLALARRQVHGAVRPLGDAADPPPDAGAAAGVDPPGALPGSTATICSASSSAPFRREGRGR